MRAGMLRVMPPVRQSFLAIGETNMTLRKCMLAALSCVIFMGGTCQTSMPQPVGLDTDGDGVPNSTDNCPLISNGNQADANLNGYGDACDPVGIWKRVSGKIFGSVSVSTNTTNHVEYIALSSDGTGALYLQDSDTNILGCGSCSFALAGSNAIIVDLSLFNTFVDGGFLSGQKTIIYTRVDANTMTFKDAAGNESTYTRVDGVPADNICKSFTLGNKYTLGVRPVSSWGSMAYDGSQLWFTEQGTANLYPINPSNGALGAANILPGGYSYIIACQGTDFWGSCACGSVSDVKRKTQAGVEVDSVDTAAAPISSQLTINCGAWDANNNVLWLSGNNSAANELRLMRVNSNANPNVLNGVTKFNAGLRAMTFRNTELWAVTSTSPQVVITINGSTFKATATYAVPDPAVAWTGIAAVGNQLYLLGVFQGAGVLQAITP